VTGVLYSKQMSNPVGVPLPTLRRLPLYLRFFKEKEKSGELWLSSEAMARHFGFGSIQIRKDLSSVGAVGSPKRGFPVLETSKLLTDFLGTDDYAEVFLVGCGSLGEAVLTDGGLASHGFKVVAVFDPDPANVGLSVSGRKVLPLSKFPDLTRRMGVKMAVLALGEPWAQIAAETLAQSEIAGVLDLSGSRIELPKSMVVVREDFGGKLSALAGEIKGRGL